MTRSAPCGPVVGMTVAEWTAIWARLVATYPGTPLPESARDEWYDELSVFDGPSVWAAVRRVRRQRHVPTLAAVLEAVDLLDREDAEQRRVRTARPPSDRHRGVPMPPELRRALELVCAPDTERLGSREVAAMCAQLAEQLVARTPARPATLRDATRSCGVCAASPVPGWIPHVPAASDAPTPTDRETWAPCEGCRPVRAEVVATRPDLAHLPTDPDGYPRGWTRRGQVA